MTDCRWKKCSQHNSKLQIPNFKGKIFHPPSLDLRNFFSQQNGRGAVGPKRLDQQVRHARDSGTISFLPALLKGSLECALTDCRWKKCSQHNSKLQIPNFKGKIFHPPSLDLRNFFSTSALLSARSNSSQSTLQENFESTSILALAMALKLWTKM